METMDVDNSDASNGKTDVLNENGFLLYPVSANDSGEGLPYAPVDWPNSGDKWRWKVGSRIAASGYFLDRYLFLPASLRARGQSSCFKSKLSIERYIQSTFPDSDVNAFFALFSWKIPSKQLLNVKENPSGSDNLVLEKGCKAGNKVCLGLTEVQNPSPEVMLCDICCSEPGFCRDCCCILCCESISSTRGAYNYIRCEATLFEGHICGHVAHIECSLRAYTAGTLERSIALDAQYYCRRCDSRTDLVPHIEKLLSVTDYSWDDIEGVLKVGYSVLRGSQRTSAKKLLHQIELAMAKLKAGTDIGNILTTEDDSMFTGTDSCNDLDASYTEAPQDYKTLLLPKLSSNFDYRVESLRLDDEIDQVLRTLKKSQESEYLLAEERLTAQRDHVLNLYQQLDKEKSELSKCSSSSTGSETLVGLKEKIEQIKQQLTKLRDMKEVANGFGRTSKHVLEEHFGWE